MNTRITLILFTLLFLSHTLLAQEGEIEIIEADESVVSVLPGEVVVKAFFISNRNAKGNTFSASLVLPSAWRAIGGPQTLRLEIKQGDTVLSAFHVPRGTIAGEYEAVLQVKNNITSQLKVEFPFSVVVKKRVEIQVEPLDVPDYVLAGEIYRSSFIVANAGNTSINAVLKAKSGEDFAFAIDAARIELMPGDAKIVVASVRTPEALGTRVSHVLRLTASPEGSPEVIATAASSTEVLPRISTGEDPYISIPSSVDLEGSYKYEDETNDEFAGRLKLAGDGEFGSATNTISYLLSLPFDPDKAIYTDATEFFLDYNTPTGDLFFGNRFYTLSPLTEPSLYGTGGAADYYGNIINTGIYHHVTSSAPPMISQTGAYIEYDTFRLNLLDSITRFGPIDDVVIGSVEGILPLDGRQALEFEFASSEGTSAFTSTLAGSHPGMSYRIGTLFADPLFPGALSDVLDYRADIGIPMNEHFRLTSSINRRYSSLSQETPALLSAQSLGMAWSISKNTNVSASYQTVLDDGGSERDVTYEMRETARIKLTRNIGEMKIDLSMSVTHETDRVADSETDKESYRLGLDERVPSGASIGTFIEHDRTRSDSNDMGTNFGVSYDSKTINDTSFRVSYRSSDRASSYYDGRDSINADLVRQLENGGALTVRASVSPDRAVNRSADAGLLAGIGFLATATYYAPFDLRIGKKELGRISGTVIDGETGRGIPDVILRIGDRISVTDLYGNYFFSSVFPGTQYIGVDSSRVEGRKIVIGGEPVTIDVIAGEDTIMDVKLVRPADIRGVVKRLSYPQNYSSRLNGQTPLIDDGGQEELLLVLTNNGALRRTLTGKDGAFSFLGLIPGIWTVTMPDASIPEGYAVEEKSISLELTAGSEGAPEFRLIPLKREIKFQDGGAIGDEAPLIEVP